MKIPLILTFIKNMPRFFYFSCMFSFFLFLILFFSPINFVYAVPEPVERDIAVSAVIPDPNIVITPPSSSGGGGGHFFTTFLPITAQNILNPTKIDKFLDGLKMPNIKSPYDTIDKFFHDKTVNIVKDIGKNNSIDILAPVKNLFDIFVDQPSKELNTSTYKNIFSPSAIPSKVSPNCLFCVVARQDSIHTAPIARLNVVPLKFELRVPLSKIIPKAPDVDVTSVGIVGLGGFAILRIILMILPKILMFF